MNEPILRRLQLQTADEEQVEAFRSLVKRKGLTRDDLMLILQSIRTEGNREE